MLPTCVAQSLKRAPRPSLSLSTFLARESPSSLSSPSLGPFLSPTSSNPFLPSKPNPLSRSWSPPKYSLRRQKTLRAEVLARGLDLSVLPPLPPPRAPAEGRPEKVFNPVPHLPRTSVLKDLGLAQKGPYVGRKVTFKGKRWERNWEKRQAELKGLLDGAEEKSREWKKAKSEERKKAKSNMPY